LGSLQVAVDVRQAPVPLLPADGTLQVDVHHLLSSRLQFVNMADEPLGAVLPVVPGFPFLQGVDAGPQECTARQLAGQQAIQHRLQLLPPLVRCIAGVADTPALAHVEVLALMVPASRVGRIEHLAAERTGEVAVVGEAGLIAGLAPPVPRRFVCHDLLGTFPICLGEQGPVDDTYLDDFFGCTPDLPAACLPPIVAGVVFTTCALVVDDAPAHPNWVA